MKKNIKRWLALLLAVIMVGSTALYSSDSFLWATDGVEEAAQTAEEAPAADVTGTGAVTPQAEETEPVVEQQEIVVPEQPAAPEPAPEPMPEEGAAGEVSLGQTVEVTPSENVENTYNVVFYRPAVEGGTLRVWAEGGSKKDVSYTNGKYAEEVKEGTTLYFEIESTGNYLVDHVKDQNGTVINPESVNENVSTYKMVINENKEITIMYKEAPKDEGEQPDADAGEKEESEKPDAGEALENSVKEAQQEQAPITAPPVLSDAPLSPAATILANRLMKAAEPDAYAVVNFVVRDPVSNTESNLLAQWITEGEKAEAPSNVPEFDGYKFAGWVNSEGNAVSFENPAAQGIINVYTKYMPIEKCIVAIHYLHSDKSTAITQPYVAEVKKGGSFAADISSPEIEGFAADKSKVEIDLSEVEEDVNYQVVYTGKPQEYKVSYQCDGKDIAEAETLTGEIGVMTQAEAKEVEGFTPGGVTNYILSVSDNPEIVVEYTRNSYTVSYDTGEKASYVKPENYAFDAELVLPTRVTRPGYTFDGWELDGKDAPGKMPAADITLTARWKEATKSSYMVVYWQEKVPGTYEGEETQYDYVESYTVNSAEVGSKATYQKKTYEGFELDAAKSDEDVIVKADGSTVKRVYYNRATYTIKFYEDKGFIITSWKENTSLRITAKYGEDISARWERACQESGWGPNKSGNTQYTLFANMPAQNLDMYEKTAGTGKQIIYRTEGLDGTYNDYATFNVSSGVSLTVEDKQPIEGFTFGEWKQSGSSPLWLNYTRNSYDLVLNECKTSGDSVKIKYEDRISKYLPKNPEPPTGVDSDYRFDGWYYSPSYLPDTKVGDDDIMPAYNVQVFAKWVKPDKTATLHINNEEIKETVSPITVEKYETIAKQLNKESAKLEKANENYEFTGWYTDAACTKLFVESTKMTEDIDLYAGWKRVKGTYEYTVRYEYKDGAPVTSIEGVDEHGTIQKIGDIDTTVTESAPSIADGFATIANKSVKLTENGLEIVFTYERADTWTYTVRYVAEDGTVLGTEEKTTSNTTVVESFKAFDQYNVIGASQQTLAKDAEDKVIIFEYAPFEKASYMVEYYQQKVDGSGYDKADTETYTEWVGTPIAVSRYTSKTYEGFTYEKVNPASGIIVRRNGQSIIKVYYTRDTHFYTVKHVDKDTGEELMNEPAPKKAVFGQEITGEQAKATIIGYKYDSANPDPLVISAVDTDNVITVYYTKRADLSYTVNYLEQGTNKAVADAKTVENQTFEAEVTENAIDIAGYEKVEPTSATITIGVENNEITFYYTKRTDLSYTVNYLEKGTNEILKPAKTVDGKTFEEKVTETAEAISGYNVDGDAEQTITIGAENNVITFYYTKKTNLSYTVKYLEAGTGKKLADEKVVGGKTFNEKVTEAAITIKGYTCQDESSKTITIQDGTNEITFYYSRRNDIAYTVNYLEQGTNTVLADAKTENDQTFGAEVTEDAIDIEGYDKVAPTSETITLAESGNVINFYYTRRTDLSYTVNYLEQGTDAVLAEAKTETGQTFKAEVTETAIEIEGYDKVEPTSKTITIEVENNVITFYYTKRTDLSYTVNYLEQGTNEVLSTAKTVENQTFGAEVTENAIDIEGYEKADPTEQTITIGVEDNVINFYYTKRTDLSYTVNYLEQGTNEVLSTAKTVENQTFEAEVTENAIDIAGYEKVEPTSATITIGVENNEITFYYTKRTDLSYTVNYLEKDTNVVLHEAKTVNGQTFQSKVTETAEPISGYNVDGDAEQTITIGADDNEITFYYTKKRDLSYTVKYLEAGTEKELAEPKTVNNQTFGDEVTEEAIRVTGYTLQDDASKTITIQDGTNEIIFHYSKRNDIAYTVNYLEQGTNTVLADAKTKNDQTFGAEVTEDAIDIEGYDKVAPTSEKITLAESGNVINFYYTKRTDLSYTVNYLEQGTNTALAEAKTETGQTFKAEVTETAIEIEGYDKAEPTSKTITIEVENNVINFYYTKRTDLSYTVNYLEQGTTNAVAPAKKVEKQTFGESVSEKAIDVEGYEKVAPTEAELTIGVTGNEITFYYTKRTDLSYTVNYLEQGTNKAVADAKTVENQTFEAEVTENAIDIAGYEKVEPTSATITIGVENNEITFYYTKRTDLSYTVNYLEKDTNVVLHEAKTVNGQIFQSKVTETAEAISGYNVDGDAEQTITIGVENNIINFYYTKKTDLSYTVKYLEAGTEKELAEPKTVNNQTFGEEVTEEAIRVTGYTLQDDASKTITIQDGTNEITFYYSKRNDIAYTVNYLEQGTNTVLADAKTENDQTFGAEVTEEAIGIEGYDKAEPTSVTITLEESGNVINFYYTKRTDLSYTVNYLEQGTDTVLAEAKTENGQTFKAEVTETAIEIEGYDKAEPTSKTITIEVKDNVINFYYTKRTDLSYTVNYLEQGTTNAVAPAKKVENQTFGAEVAENAINIEGYEKADPTEQTITIGVENNIITFYYTKRTDLSYTVNYLEKDTNNVVAPAKKVEKQTFKAEVTESAIDVTGYNKVDPTTATIEIGTDKNEITFYYTKRTDLSYTVNYLEKGTNEILKPAKTVDGKTFEEKVTETAEAIGGYNVDGDAEQTITIGVENNIINFYYTKKTDLSYTVKYLEAGTEEELAEPKTVNNQTFGEEVTEEAIRVTGYTLQDDASKTITIQDGTNEIIFHYSKRNDIAYTVNYLEQGTNTVLADAKTENDQTFGAEVTEDAIDIEGYDKVAPTSETITLAESGNVINFYYTKRTDLSYTVNYLEQGTDAVLAEAKTETGQIFEAEVTETAIEIEGYDKVEPTSETITIGVGTNEITFYYTKRTDLSYTVNYLEQGTNEVLSTAKTVENQTFGEEVTEEAIDIEGYNKVDPTSAAITIGADDNVINFYYTKRTDLSYTVNYLEQGTDKAVADAKTVENQTFEAEVAENAIDIEGYEKIAPTSQAITIGVEDNVINFYYTKRTDLSYTVNYLEKGTNEILKPAKTVDGQTFEAEVTETAEAISGYNVDGDAEQTITIGVENNIINFYYTKKTDLSYTVKYLEAGTEKELADEKVVEGKTFKEEVTEDAVTIRGYTLQDDASKTITIQDGTNEIIFHYSKRNDIAYTVNYLEQGTNTVLADAKTKNDQTFGEKVTEDAIDIEGYDKVAPTSETITLAESGNVINFYYTKRTDLSYTVNYLEKGTDAVLAEAKTENGQTFKAEVTETAIEIEGYDKAEPTSKTITIEVENNVINFYYTKRTDLSYKVNYLEKDTNKVLLAAKNVDNQTFESMITSASQVEEITGYTFDSAEPEELAIGTDASKNVMNLYYTANAQKYTVNYLEKGTGNVLKAAEEKDTKFAEKIVGASEAVKITNYLYDSVDPAELTVGTDNGKNVINVYYVLDENGPDGGPDEIPDSEEYHVRYEGNGGLTKMGEAINADPNIYPAGYEEVYAWPGDLFTKENAVFAYWKDKKTGERVEADEVFTMPEEDVTLVAQWKELTVTKNYTLKADHSPFKLGERIDFTIEVTSSGDADLTEPVVVTDLLPGAVIDEGAGYAVENNTAVIPAGMKAQSMVTVNAHYMVTADEMGKTDVVNRAKATTEGIEEEDSTDPIPMDEAEKQLTMKKTVTNLDEATGTDENGNQVFALGDTVKFDIEVMNTGNQDLSDIEVTDEWADAVIVGGDGYTVRNNVAVIDSLKAGKDGVGEMVTVKVEYEIQEKDLGNSNFRNVATAKAGDDTPGTGTTDPIPVDEKNPEFSVEKSIVGDQRDVNVGQTINYTITVTNTGNMDLNNVEVTDTLQGTAGQVTFAEQSGVTVNGNVATIDSLPTGSALTLNCSYVVTRADAGASISNAVVVNGSTPDPENPDPEPKRDETDGTDVENLYTLTINYVYATGGIAAPSVVAQYLAGESFSYTSPTIAGYTADYGLLRSDVQGMPARDVVLTVVYTAIPAPVVPPTPGPGPAPVVTPPAPALVPAPAAAVPAAAIVLDDEGNVEVVPVADEEVPLTNRELDDHHCCILHFLLMLLALIIYAFYTRSMKKRQQRIAELADELETEKLKRELGMADNKENAN